MNIPTAEEFFIQLGFMENHHKLGYDIKTAMVEFAKLHVQAALEEANQVAIINSSGTFILNSYPLTNIK